MSVMKKKEFGKTSETVRRFGFLSSVTGFSGSSARMDGIINKAFGTELMKPAFPLLRFLFPLLHYYYYYYYCITNMYTVLCL
jgi:hypothetical protein